MREGSPFRASQLHFKRGVFFVFTGNIFEITLKKEAFAILCIVKKNHLDGFKDLVGFMEQFMNQAASYLVTRERLRLPAEKLTHPDKPTSIIQKP